MAFWWVNHKQTREHEVRGGYLWSPMRNANGAFNQSYENMTLVQPGDLVFSFANGRIGAVGTVTDAASAAPKPEEFGSVGDYWSNEGWFVPVYFAATPRPLRVAEQIDSIRPFLPDRYSPIQKNGHGNQGCYLASISDALGHLLLTLLEIDADPVFATKLLVNDAPDADILTDISNLQRDSSIPETQRIQLTKARVGQGVFRSKVLLLGPYCRVTRVDDARLLIASHIKPWKDSSNSERISGHNGIMLSPHVDALFDDKLISFEDQGRMLVHPSLSRDVLDKWSIDPSRPVDRFRPEHAQFLAHHRAKFAEKVG